MVPAWRPHGLATASVHLVSSHLIWTSVTRGRKYARIGRVRDFLATIRSGLAQVRVFWRIRETYSALNDEDSRRVLVRVLRRVSVIRLQARALVVTTLTRSQLCLRLRHRRATIWTLSPRSACRLRLLNVVTWLLRHRTVCAPQEGPGVVVATPVARRASCHDHASVRMHVYPNLPRTSFALVPRTVTALRPPAQCRPLWSWTLPVPVPGWRDVY